MDDIFEAICPLHGAVIIIDLPGYPPQLPEFADMDEPMDEICLEVSDG